RPLLEDLLQEETYFEARHVKDAPGDLVLAVRVEESRASAWQSHLQAVVEALAGVRVNASSNGFSVWLTNGVRLANGRLQYPAASLSFSHAGAWGLLALSPDPGSSLAKDLATR